MDKPGDCKQGDIAKSFLANFSTEKIQKRKKKEKEKRERKKKREGISLT